MSQITTGRVVQRDEDRNTAPNGSAALANPSSIGSGTPLLNSERSLHAYASSESNVRVPFRKFPEPGLINYSVPMHSNSS